MKKISLLLCSLLWGTHTLLQAQTSIYVDQSYTGNTPDGSLANPYKTIQEAADAAVEGTTVNVRKGTYRETVTVQLDGTSAAPIIFQPYNNENVTVSGTKVITGWTLDAGNIYKATVPSDFFTSSVNQSLQIFANGHMMNLARWPNTGFNSTQDSTAVSYPAKGKMESYGGKSTVTLSSIKWNQGIMTDNDLTPTSTDYYKDAEIFFQPNYEGWSWAFSGKVTAQTGGTLTFISASGSTKDGASVYDNQSRYYLFNLKKLLDSEGEWFHDKTTNTLYLWAPGGVDPNTMVIEGKVRDYAFNLTDRSYITLKGFNVFGASITTDSLSGGNGKGYNANNGVIYPWKGSAQKPYAMNIVIDGIKAKYLNHYTDVSGDFNQQRSTMSGIVVSGENCVIKNCTIQYSAGNGILLGYKKNKALNNYITDCNYAATYCGGVAIQSPVISHDMEIAYNTIKRTGRDGLLFDFLVNNTPTVATNTEFGRVHHNDVGDFCIQDWDCGGIKARVSTNSWSRVDHNFVHSPHPNVDNIPDGGNITVGGIYVDISRNKVLDHNVIRDVDWGFHLQNVAGGGTSAANYLIYNNTIGTSGISNKYGSYGIVGNSTATMNGSVVVNNIIYSTTNITKYAPLDGDATKGFMSSSVTNSNNLYWDYVANSATDPLFTNEANNDFTLKSGSNAIDKGITVPTYFRDSKNIPAWNDAIAGSAVDIGAYEYGAVAWKAGVDAGLVTANNLITEDYMGGDVIIYPNPSNAEFTIASSFIEPVLFYEIYNVMGEKEIVINNNLNQVAVNMADKAKGSYLLLVHYPSRTIKKKLLLN